MAGNDQPGNMMRRGVVAAVTGWADLSMTKQMVA